ncbi:hypothetical protein GIB67_006759 [Kingdonia uniflora]|uniref:BZIP domain-containing protein n=1 Tax=Kingdonia uniflora TaxID=39325 RepID=A0A7J7LYR3_9MAGN|nr:hypothetical protein GIB67_006759 [Kingdonia uniflora]
MGIQTMGSLPLARQSSFYTLTLDEVENHLGEPLSSMNLDELLKNVWTAEANHNNTQPTLTLNNALSKKTVDEVWRDIQHDGDHQFLQNTTKAAAKETQATLGEMTLEDFLVKAGIVAEGSAEPQWLHYQHQQQQQQHMMGVGVGVYQPIAVVTNPHSYQMDVSTSPQMATSSDTQTPRLKRRAPGEVVEKTVERRQKRMIKNRESAARSRARKQAYTNELENKVARLEEENARLKKQKDFFIGCYSGYGICYSNFCIATPKKQTQGVQLKTVEESTKLFMESNKELTESNKAMFKQLVAMLAKLCALASSDGDGRFVDAIEDEVEVGEKKIVKIAKLEADVIKDSMRFDGVGLKMNQYKEMTKML